MLKEKFESSSLLRKQMDEIINLFNLSSSSIGDERNQIKIVEFEGKKLVVKSFKVPNVINKIAYRFLRKSKAARSYKNAVYLQHHGIGTPSPIAFLETYNSTLFDQSFYVSEYCEHDFTYREIIHDDSMEGRDELLKQFTRFMHKMHEADIFFQDHSPGNTLIKLTDNEAQFYLVDLNRMKFFSLDKEHRVKNFERLSPYRWMHEIMGREYARLMGWDKTETVVEIMIHVDKFQESFYRKRRLKNRLKKIAGKPKKLPERRTAE